MLSILPFFLISDFPLFSLYSLCSSFLLAFSFPQLCYWLCHLVPVPKRWTQLWFATRGLRVGAWHHGRWFQNNLRFAVVTHFASDGHRDQSSMWLQLSIVLSKNFNLQSRAWRCTSVEQSKLKEWRRDDGSSCVETNQSVLWFWFGSFFSSFFLNLFFLWDKLQQFWNLKCCYTNNTA